MVPMVSSLAEKGAGDYSSRNIGSLSATNYGLKGVVKIMAMCCRVDTSVLCIVIRWNVEQFRDEAQSDSGLNTRAPRCGIAHIARSDSDEE